MRHNNSYDVTEMPVLTPALQRDAQQFSEETLRELENGSTDPYLQFFMGQAYAHGAGVGRDMDRAITWYTKAADQGNVRSLVALGLIYGDKRIFGKNDCDEKHLDSAKSVDCFAKAAEQKDADGSFFMGVCYEQGFGVGKNKLLMLEHYNNAALEGHPDAQYRLALFWAEATHIPDSKQLAIMWCKTAAADREAQFGDDGVITLDSGKVLRVPDAMQNWKCPGHPGAQRLLGKYYEEGKDGVQRDPAEAVALYRKAAEQEYAEAQFDLGRCYANGIGVGKSRNQAISWYEKAAAQNHVEAQEQLTIIRRQETNRLAQPQTDLFRPQGRNRGDGYESLSESKATFCPCVIL